MRGAGKLVDDVLVRGFQRCLWHDPAAVICAVKDGTDPVVGCEEQDREILQVRYIETGRAALVQKFFPVIRTVLFQQLIMNQAEDIF